MWFGRPCAKMRQDILGFWVLAYIMVGVYGDCEDQPIPKICDFIIVGAGAAGATIAGRLSEVTDITVCLIEAGPKDTGIPISPAIETPRLWTRLISDEITYNYSTVPQKGLNGRSIFAGMGKALGGSTTHNGLAYFRGVKADYDNWAANGATGWSYDDVFPFFLKSENNVSPLLEDSDFHSKCGPLSISQDLNFVTTPLYKLFVAAAKERRIPLVDCTEPLPLGLCLAQSTVKEGKRQSSSVAFLNPVLERKNLVVLTETLVKKILIHKYGRRAYGVRISRKGKEATIKVRREVIVSAGAIDTPKLLQLSGIGPKPLLNKFKIQSLSNLPVGENYHDHPEILTVTLAQVPTVTPDVLSDPRSFSDYVFERKGIYAETGITWNLFTELKSQQRFNWPEFQALWVDGILSFGNEVSFNMNGTTSINYLLHPKSRGTVKIQSRNSFVPALIDPNVFADRRDIQTLIQGIRRVQKLVKTSAMRTVNARFAPNSGIPQKCRNFRFDSNKQWICILRDQAIIGLHPVGTCKMGDNRDTSTVVDPKLRVKGIKGLRVADASIMPEITSANTMGPSIMIGEKAADIIKKDYKLTSH